MKIRQLWFFPLVVFYSNSFQFNKIFQICGHSHQISKNTVVVSVSKNALKSKILRDIIIVVGDERLELHL